MRKIISVNTCSYYAYPIAQAMRNVEITPIMFHEIGHSLGFLANREQNPFGLVTYDNEKMNMTL